MGTSAKKVNPSARADAEQEAVSAEDARIRFSELLGRVVYAGERISITRYGKVVAVLVNPRELERLPAA